jgi:hypothetical protein
MTEQQATAMQFYNPERIIELVEQHLREQGLHPRPATEDVKRTQLGAGMLLQGFGIMPAGGVEMIDRRNAPDDW